MVKRFVVAKGVMRDDEHLQTGSLRYVLSSDYDALAAELARYEETLSICQDRNARAHAETAAANARIRELEAEFVAYKDDATTAIAMYKKDVAEKCCRIRELEAELAADNELFQQRWREWQAERDCLDRSMRESWASEKRLAARIRELEAALRKVLIVYGDEHGDGAEGDAIAAVRACFPAETGP